MALGLVLGRLERGVLRVPQGHAGGLAFDMRHLPISHAHFGSIAFGNLESAVQEAMVRHLGDGGVFYDIGANIGFFALLGAHLAGLESGHVYAFEAAPDNAEAIRVERSPQRDRKRHRDLPRRCRVRRVADGCRWSTTRAGRSSRTTASTRTPSR